MSVHNIKILLHLLVGLLPPFKNANIAIFRVLNETGWDIFLIFWETFPGYFWTIYKSFQISCLSVRWLTSLLKLGLNRDIPSSVRDVFLKIFRGIPGMLVCYIQIILNLLVGLLPYLSNVYKCSEYYIFLKFSKDITGMFLHYFWILPNFVYVCQSGN